MSNPRVVVYDVPRTDAAKLRSAVLVVPGGGFGLLADEHEGSDVCRWLNEQGIVSFLVLHRVPTGKMPVPNAAPVQDIQKAVQEVRRRAAEFQIDPAKIAVLGFSAGGQATLVAATTPPMFIAQCGDDPGSVPQGSANLYLKLVEAKVPAEIHIYEKGGHGYGLKAGNTLPGQLDWKARGIDWLRGRGW